MKGKALLIIAPDSYPPGSAESIVTLKFLKGLKKQNVKFFVLHLKPYKCEYPIIADESDFNSVSGFFIDPTEKIKFLKKYFSKLNVIIWIILCFFYGVKIIRKNNIRILMSRSMPVYGHFPALLISKFCKIFWVANWSDPAPYSISPYPYQKHNRYSSIIFKICKKIIRKADLHTFPNQYLKDYMQKHFKDLEGKSAILPHIAYSQFYQEPTNYTSIFTLCHTGSLYKRSPVSLLEALKLFKLKYGNNVVKFIFVGASVDDFKESLPQEIEIVPPVTYQQSLQILEHCDVALVIEAKTEQGIFFPSKVLDIIQLGLPIFSLSPKTGVMADLINQEGGGIVAGGQDIEAIFISLEKLYLAYKNETLQKIYSSKVYRKKFHEDAVILAFLNKLTILTN